MFPPKDNELSSHCFLQKGLLTIMENFVKPDILNRNSTAF